MGFAGLNITHPCKQAVIPLLHELSPDAQALGAVNTVVLRDGKRVGHNTDWWGFAENFRRGLPDAHARPRGATGCRRRRRGGGARGADAGRSASLTICDVDRGRAARLGGQPLRQLRRRPCGRLATDMAAAWQQPTG